MDQNFIRNFCILAHIDHGKSTLADRFLELTKTVEPRKMHPQYLDQMDLEQERGITIKMQPVRMAYHAQIPNPLPTADLPKGDKSQIPNQGTTKNFELGNSNLGFADSAYMLNLIDTPGHVDFSYEVSRALAAVEGAILLVDATKGIQAQTFSNFRLAKAQGLVLLPAVNKIDMPNAMVEETKQSLARLCECVPGEVLLISAKTGAGVDALLEASVKKLPSPRGRGDGPLRALIFDSRYDPYQGTIAYVRVVDGSVRKGESLEFLQTDAESEALDCGYFGPDLVSTGELLPGEIGWIATGLKDIRKCRVGDTITLGSSKSQVQSSKRVEPLPGYKEPLPMVFAGVYPEDPDRFDMLRDALEKLQLNDAALDFELDTTQALGRGFRCGFLGMLHLEIVLERIRREYGLSVVVTHPHVEYFAKFPGDKKSIIRTPQEWPDPATHPEFEEPWANIELFTPPIYLGAVQELVRQKRGLIEDVETDMYGGNLLISGKMPFAEIIVDFADRLKSATSGWGSFNYEVLGFERADLVRLDILVAGEEVPELSVVLPRDNAYREGKEIVVKLKDILPKEQFAVSLQAAVGGKILARETIPAMRKDVTGYLYGGDYTRKRKLLEKQKKGKKRLRARGTVDIPAKVFLDLLKR